MHECVRECNECTIEIYIKRKILEDYRIKPRDESNDDDLYIREFYRILSSRDSDANRIDSLSFDKARGYKFEILDISFVD